MSDLVCTAPLTEQQLEALRDILTCELMEAGQQLSMACMDGCDAMSFARRVREVSELLDAFGWARFPVDTTEDVG